MLIQKYTKSIVLVIIATVSIYLISAITLGWRDSINLINNISITGWFGLILCSFTSYTLRYARWFYFIKKLGHVIPHSKHFLYYLSAFALTVTPAKVGETIRSIYLFNHGVSYSKSLSSFFVERLLDLTVVTLLSSLLLFQQSEYSFFIIVLFIVIIMLILLFKTSYIQQTLKYFIVKTRSEKISQQLKNIISLLTHSKSLLKFQVLLPGLILGFIAWVIQGTAFYLLLNQLGFNIAIYSAISIYSIALIAGALSFIPGGLGATEVVMAVFLYYFGAPKDIVVIAPIIIRITSLWFAVIVGLISTMIITKNLNVESN